MRQVGDENTGEKERLRRAGISIRCEVGSPAGRPSNGPVAKFSCV